MTDINKEFEQLLEEYTKTAKDAEENSYSLLREQIECEEEEMAVSEEKEPAFEEEDVILGDGEEMVEEKDCWKGYKKVGTKKKGGKTVNNCVKEEDEFDIEGDEEEDDVEGSEEEMGIAPEYDGVPNLGAMADDEIITITIPASLASKFEQEDSELIEMLSPYKVEGEEGGEDVYDLSEIDDPELIAKIKGMLPDEAVIVYVKSDETESGDDGAEEDKDYAEGGMEDEDAQMDGGSFEDDEDESLQEKQKTAIYERKLKEMQKALRQLAKKNKDLKESVDMQNKVIVESKKTIQKVMLTNQNLANMWKLSTGYVSTASEKREIMESFSKKVSTINESNLMYEFYEKLLGRKRKETSANLREEVLKKPVKLNESKGGNKDTKDSGPMTSAGNSFMALVEHKI